MKKLYTQFLLLLLLIPVLHAQGQLPVAVNDTVVTRAGIVVKIRPLLNDIKNSFDTLVLGPVVVENPKQGYRFIEGDTVIYYPAFQAEGIQTLKYYILSDTSMIPVTSGQIIIHILKQPYYDSLTVNNINAGVNASGSLFSRHLEFPVNDESQFDFDFVSHFKYPVDAQTSTIFMNTLWLGGYDDQGGLHIASERYQQDGTEWRSGPVSDVYDTTYLKTYARLWKLNSTDIDYHRQHYYQAGYEPIEAIQSWPGNGNPELGQALNLAPYFDFNSDGTYNCMDGDYPLIRGDQCIFFMFNDDLPHGESGGTPLKVEMHCMVYGFNEPSDTALFHTVFTHYDIINRSENVYTDCLAGIYNDIDLGYYGDDYQKCDVQRGSFIGYNATEFDGFEGFPQGYGDNPPAQSVTVLSGPLMDPDGIDNADGICNESVNGLNFGNQIADDERSGLMRFIFFRRMLNSPFPSILLPEEHYNYMNGFWDDSTRVLYGGIGHVSVPVTETLARYMFPGDSDPLNWGTDCQYPAAGYNQDGKFWTEEEALLTPGDRRGLGTMGPFTLNPGIAQELEIAFVIGQGQDGPQSSVAQLLRNIDSLLYKVEAGTLLVSNDALGIAPDKLPVNVMIYPNPAIDIIYLEGIKLREKADYAIYDLYGRCLLKGALLPSVNQEIRVKELPSGMYIIRAATGRNAYTGKFMKL